MSGLNEFEFIGKPIAIIEIEASQSIIDGVPHNAIIAVCKETFKANKVETHEKFKVLADEVAKKVHEILDFDNS